jgi:hypothetical protein
VSDAVAINGAITAEMVGAGCKQASCVSNIMGADTDIYLNLIVYPSMLDSTGTTQLRM